jgi:hypothetical protein
MALENKSKQGVWDMILRARRLAPGHRPTSPQLTSFDFSVEALERRALMAVGLVAAYAFDEGAGAAAADASSTGNGASVSGAAWTAGKYGGALSFDGVNDMVTVPDAASLDLTTEMTLEAWVRPASNSNWGTVILKERGAGLAYSLYSTDGVNRPPSAYVYRTRDVRALGTGTLALNTWSHLGGTYDGANLRLYVNGALASTTAVTGAMPATTNALRIGGNTVWGEYFNGLIDDVRVYNRALTIAEIQTDMSTPVATPAPDTTAPTATVTAPADRATVSGTTTVSASATDNVAVAGVRFLLDGNPLGAEDTTAPYSVAWNTAGVADGPHTLTAVARDAAGNTSTANPVNVTVANADTTFPTVSLTTPADGTTVSGTTPVFAAATDNIGVVGVQFLLDGTPLGAEDTAAPYSIAWDTTTVPNGAHTLTAQARDAAGNVTTSAGRRVTVAPDFSFTVLDSTKTVASTGREFYEIDVAYLNGFTSSSVDLWYQTLPAGVAADFAFDPMSHQGRTELFIDTTNATPGTYTVTIGATGEGISHTQAITLVVTTAVDFALSVSPSVQTVVSGSSTPFAVNLTETNDFTSPVSLSVPNLPTGMTATFTPMTAVPVATSTLTIATTATVTPGTYTLNVTGTAGSVFRTTPITVTVTAASAAWSVQTMGSTGVPNNTVRVGALKGDGQQRVYIGTIQTGRMLEYSWSNGTWAGPVDVGGSPTGHEIHDVTIGPGRGDGRDRIYAASYDFKIYEIWFDGTNWQQMAVGTLDNLGMHTVVGVGRNDGVTRLYAASTQTLYEFTWNGTSWNQVTIGSAPGAHNLALGAPRGDGLNRVYIASISKGTSEVTFNGTSWSIASMGDTGDARSVNLGAGRNDGVVRVYSALLDGRLREFTWNGSSWSILNSAVVPGAQHIHAYVLPGRNDGVLRVYTSSSNGRAYEFTWDGAGWSVYNMGGGSDYLYGLNYGVGRNDGVIRLYGADRGAVNRVYEYTWSTPDAVPPAVSMTAPASGTTVSGAVTVNANATDNVGVAGVQFFLDGVPLGDEDATAPYSTAWNTGATANGSHTLTARGRDASGNQTTSTGVAVNVANVDGAPPTVSITGPAAGATLSGVATITAVAGDDVGVLGVQFLLDGVALGAEDTAAPYSFTWNTTTAANGPRVLTARSRDAAGNVTLSGPVNVTVTNTAPSALVAAWGFDDGAGTTLSDASGNSRHGSISGGAIWTAAGRFGGALSFDGVNDLVTVPDADALDLTAGLTLEAWVNPSAVTGYTTVVLKERPNGLVYALYASDNTGRPPAGYVNRTTDVSALGNSTLPLNAWSHLAFTYDATTLRMYVNGTQVGTRAMTGDIRTSTGMLRIGGNAVWGEYFKGLIDEVRMYSRALSASEIQADMNAPIGPPAAAAVVAPTSLTKDPLTTGEATGLVTSPV